MADISTYIQQIETAARGEEVRDSIVNALNAINESALGVFDDTPTAGSTNAVTSQGIKAAIDAKQDALTFDDAPVENSDNPVKSSGLYEALQNIQQALTFDETPTEGSENPVKSGGIYDALSNIDFNIDSEPTEGSTHAVSSGSVYAGLAAKQDALTFDEYPVLNSSNPVESNGIYNSIRGLHQTVLKSSVTLLADEWDGSDPYTQTVAIENATTYSKVDIQADDAQIAQLIADNVRALRIDIGDSGALIAHAVGGVNSVDMTFQCTLTDISEVIEVAVVDDILVFPGTDYPAVVDDVLML